MFRRIGVLLELKGENAFKVRAYETAARKIENSPAPLIELSEQATLGNVKGLGKATAAKLEILVATGELPYLGELESSFPKGLLELLRVRGLGPKKVKRLYEELGIASLSELEYACQENHLTDLKGFGAKSQGKILTAVEHLKKFAGRFHLHVAKKKAEEIFARLNRRDLCRRLEICGSIRRTKETIKDIDLLAVSQTPQTLITAFVQGEGVEQVTGQGETKASVILESGMAVDLRVVPPEAFGAAQLYFTGSAQHNTQLRSLAKKQRLKLNEYGLFIGDTALPLIDEQSIYKALGLQWIRPQLREGTGEIEAAEKGELPTLVEHDQIQGVLHVHTNFSDGTEGVKAMAKACGRHGYRYLGICDHSQSAAYAGGLLPEDLVRQRKKIDAQNAKHPDFRIFAGIESDILSDGALDYAPEVLAELDFVIASVHSGFGDTKKQMTQRIVRAVENRYTKILAHPTGRLLLGRQGYALDMDTVLDACAANGVAVELNANPFRFDIDWRSIRGALSRGVKIAINPDAHSINQIDYIQMGVQIAQKGWCEAKDILNVLSADEFAAFCKEGK